MYVNAYDPPQEPKAEKAAVVIDPAQEVPTILGEMPWGWRYVL